MLLLFVFTIDLVLDTIGKAGLRSLMHYRLKYLLSYNRYPTKVVLYRLASNLELVLDTKVEPTSV
jgi:hypothetical protein